MSRSPAEAARVIITHYYCALAPLPHALRERHLPDGLSLKDLLVKEDPAAALSEMGSFDEYFRKGRPPERLKTRSALLEMLQQYMGDLHTASMLTKLASEEVALAHANRILLLWFNEQMAGPANPTMITKLLLLDPCYLHTTPFTRDLLRVHVGQTELSTDERKEIQSDFARFFSRGVQGGPQAKGENLRQEHMMIMAELLDPTPTGRKIDASMLTRLPGCWFGSLPTEPYDGEVPKDDGKYERFMARLTIRGMVLYDPARNMELTGLEKVVTNCFPMVKWDKDKSGYPAPRKRHHDLVYERLTDAWPNILHAYKEAREGTATSRRRGGYYEVSVSLLAAKYGYSYDTTKKKVATVATTTNETATVGQGHEPPSDGRNWAVLDEMLRPRRPGSLALTPFVTLCGLAEEEIMGVVAAGLTNLNGPSPVRS